MRVSWPVRLFLLTGILSICVAFLPRPAGQSDSFLLESRVIARIREIHIAETEYFSEHGHYAGDLRELASIDENLANDAVKGYRITPAGNPDGYMVSAIPSNIGPRSPSFHSDKTMVIHQHPDAEFAK
jgi:hypothetical protein